MRSGRWLIALSGLMLWALAVPASAIAQWPVTASGFPDVSGGIGRKKSRPGAHRPDGREPRRDVYVWKYQLANGGHDLAGRRGDRKTGHFAGVPQSSAGFAQDRRMTLSADGLALRGQSTFVGGGGHPLDWRRSSPLPVGTSGTSQAGSHWVTNSTGSPDISGDWKEGPNQVRIDQTGASLVATCTYGSISWRMEGTISRDGVVVPGGLGSYRRCPSILGRFCSGPAHDALCGRVGAAGAVHVRRRGRPSAGLEEVFAPAGQHPRNLPFHRPGRRGPCGARGDGPCPGVAPEGIQRREPQLRNPLRLQRRRVRRRGGGRGTSSAAPSSS